MISDDCNKSDFFDKILAIDLLFGEWLGNSPLRPDAKLLLLIAARGSVTIKEAMYSCTLSNRSFYQMIDRLKIAKKILVVPDQIDRRVNRIILNDVLVKVPEHITRKFTEIGCLNNNACQMTVRHKNRTLMTIPTSIND